MIKSLFVGLWSGGVALGAAYLAMYLNAAKPGDTEHASDGPPVVEFIKSDSLSVPVIRDGKVKGYVVSEFSFAVGKAGAGEAETSPMPYLTDAVYRSLYENVTADFEHLKPQDLKQLSQTIKQAANERMGKEMVQDVLVSSMNFVPRGEVRTNWVQKK